MSNLLRRAGIRSVRGEAISEEHVKGGVEKVGGRIKEAVGALAGNERLKAEGQFDQVKGGAHQAWGDVKDAAKDLAARLHQNTVKGGSRPERDALKRTDLP